MTIKRTEDIRHRLESGEPLKRDDVRYLLDILDVTEKLAEVSLELSRPDGPVYVPVRP